MWDFLPIVIVEFVCPRGYLVAHRWANVGVCRLLHLLALFAMGIENRLRVEVRGERVALSCKRVGEITLVKRSYPGFHSAVMKGYLVPYLPKISHHNA